MRKDTLHHRDWKERDHGLEIVKKNVITLAKPLASIDPNHKTVEKERDPFQWLKKRKYRSHPLAPLLIATAGIIRSKRKDAQEEEKLARMKMMCFFPILRDDSFAFQEFSS
ncbi:hypothetical protein HNY73_000421 [Argiope bruennichi]|uniref:Uncharacterized protein n=1 Tax=Argiope bruennichi TaxID=94029 RepID=A0A8T0FY22_ARGBR|nr:hypothetical protein HNY73_000421 [Argiope bruennichi]